MKTKQKGINKLEGPVTDIPIELPERRAYGDVPAIVGGIARDGEHL